jgi:hypothetical protein
MDSGSSMRSRVRQYRFMDFGSRLVLRIDY